MKPDKRMYLLRNMDSLKDKSVEYETRQFKAFSDSEIEGEFDNGFYSIRTEDIIFKRGVINTTLTIETKEKKVLYKHPINIDRNKFTKSGFYHGGGVADEILELSSLFLRRRLIRQNRTVSYSMKEFLKEYGVEGWADESLILGNSNLNELYKWFELIEGLKEKYHLKFMFATKMYYNAILIIENKPDIAYLNLISAIEVFLNDYKYNKSIKDLTDNNNSLKKFLESIDNTNLRKQIEMQMLEMNDFKKKKFTDFIINHIGEEFWDRGEFPQEMDNFEILKEVGCFVEKEELDDREISVEGNPKKLKGILSKIYNQRSSSLLAGEPFQPHIFELIRPNSKIEIPSHMDYIMGDRKWEHEDFIPYPHFLERLVNHVLKNFLIKNQKG